MTFGCETGKGLGHQNSAANPAAPYAKGVSHRRSSQGKGHKLPTMTSETINCESSTKSAVIATCRESGPACSQDHRFPALRLQHGGQSNMKYQAGSGSATGRGRYSLCGSAPNLTESAEVTSMETPASAGSSTRGKGGGPNSSEAAPEKERPCPNTEAA